MAPRTSLAWRYFKKIPAIRNKFTCKLCQKCISSNGPSNLKRHLRIKHPRCLEEPLDPVDSDADPLQDTDLREEDVSDSYTEYNEDEDEDVKYQIERDEDEYPEDTNRGGTKRKAEERLELENTRRIPSKDEYWKNVVELTCDQGVRFSLWDSSLALKLVRYSDSLITTNAASVEEQTHAYHSAMLRRIKEEIHGKIVALRLDIVSRRRGRFPTTLLGVSVQFLDSWKAEIRCIGVMTLNKFASTEEIQRQIRQLFESVGLKTSNISTVTIDDGSNVLNRPTRVKEIGEGIPSNEWEDEDDEGDVEYLRCLEDILRTAIVAVIQRKSTTEELRSASQVVQWAVNSYLMELSKEICDIKEQAKTIQEHFYKQNNKSDAPIIANSARWSSLFFMVSEEC